MQNSLYLEQVTVGPEAVLGRLGDGMVVVEDALRIGRLYTAAVSLGAMKPAVQLMLRFASRRNVSSGRLLHNPVTLHALTSVVARISIVSRLVQSIAKELDNGRSCPAEIAMVAKVAGTAFSNDTASDLMQLLGGRGYMENNLAPQLLRDARPLSIGEGPNEALTMHIGRSEVQTHRVSQYLRRTFGGAAACRNATGHNPGSCCPLPVVVSAA